MRIGRWRGLYNVTSLPRGSTGLLAGAISNMLRVCAPIGAAEMTLPTPCPDWDLGRLLGHLCESMTDLETALRTGRLDLGGPVGRAGGDPVEALRERAAELLCASYCYGGPERFVAVGGLPIPAGLAVRMLRLSPLLVAGREGLFAVPVEVPAQASPGDRLVGYLGRNPGRSTAVTGE